MKRLLILCCALLFSHLANAESMKVIKFKQAGPFVVNKPFMVDEVDVNSKVFDVKQLLDTPLSFEQLQNAPFVEVTGITNSTENYTITLYGFYLENTRYATGELKVEGVENYQVYLDGKKLEGGKLTLSPATHTVVIKHLAAKGTTETLNVTVEAPEDIVSVREDGKKLFTLMDVLHGKRLSGVQISPCGKYLISNYTTSLAEGKSERVAYVQEILGVGTKKGEMTLGKIVAQSKEGIKWMPQSSRYYFTRHGVGGRELVAVDPANGEESILAKNLPDGRFSIAPTEDWLLYSLEQEGPKERETIYEVIEPDDRQPGWRKRSYLAKYSLSTGLMQPLTFGYHSVWNTDISNDGKHILAMVSESRLTKRPTTLYTLYKIDVNTLEAEVLVEKDGFINNAQFSPDNSKVLICGSPEALNGIGKNVKEGQTPSMYDYQLYIMELADKKITPVTREFNPNVASFVWSELDGNIYFTAENKDFVSLFKMTPSTGAIEQMEVKEELLKGFSIAKSAPVLAYYGQGATNSDRSYLMSLRSGKSILADDLSATILKDTQIGECKAWSFVNSKGDTISARYYLPPYFDSNKKYPMIVNYYGGCSPTSRNFESRYPHHAYAALGYVVLVVNPSGATGFGQEFSARHVNTAGEGPAEDIIEGTMKFCEENQFVNSKKIGCIGASYGGFMTQYLQTKTDIFAAAISHAGISDHTSYWGEGYWGYSYSEVSMANSYPWSDVELYVNQSPLYNAHKINTPLLFVHGDSDTNVPVGESIQMYTALKLLGRPTAMVLVKDQDHHILDYTKRIQWQNTIFAWFAKWLQDDPAWWEALYPAKSL